ncbi:hypothetical protein B0T24DRAFT_600243 [Lasiosphaeria ovina]|uniref:Uncharacterized protein n=1 Tax=Lasiosphaeria ovina TaxID=92902 RepID=A0AAE0JRC1_9PEZI|nr:hypothetical protein B0T24DRAFT_600243 [Lasiosphaeria ovina]
MKKASQPVRASRPGLALSPKIKIETPVPNPHLFNMEVTNWYGRRAERRRIWENTADVEEEIFFDSGDENDPHPRKRLARQRRNRQNGKHHGKRDFRAFEGFDGFNIVDPGGRAHVSQLPTAANDPQGATATETAAQMTYVALADTPTTQSLTLSLTKSLTKTRTTTTTILQLARSKPTTASSVGSIYETYALRAYIGRM